MTLGLVTLWRTLVLSAIITAFASTLASAQTTAAAPSAAAIPSFAQAIQGIDVWVTAEGARVRGQVKTLSPTGLVLMKDGVATTIAYDKVVRVEKSTHRIRNGTIIGLSVGTGTILTLMAAGCMGDCSAGEWAGYPVLWGGSGAAIGAGLGALMNAAKRHGDLVYDAQHGAKTKTTSLAPILSPTRKGVAFSMTWR